MDATSESMAQRVAEIHKAIKFIPFTDIEGRYQTHVVYHSGLLALPLEIRLQIYSDVFITTHTPLYKHNGVSRNLLCVCRQIRNEASRLFYKLWITDMWQTYVARELDRNVRKIKRILSPVKGEAVQAELAALQN